MSTATTFSPVAAASCANTVKKSSHAVTESSCTASHQVGQPLKAIQPKGFLRRFSTTAGF